MKLVQHLNLFLKLIIFYTCLKFAKLAKMIYFTDWYNWPEEHKKMIKLFILQTQKPVYIMIGPQFQMTLATFLSFWNRSYSAFTTLRGIGNNSNQ